MTVKACFGHDAVPDQARGAVVALGNFDGVHRGHAAVIGVAADLARDLGAPAGAAVFSPHPRRVFAPDTPPFALMNNAQRVRALGQAGAEIVHHIAFDKALAAMSPEGFVDTVLHKGLGLKGVVTGADFCFGQGRAGSVYDLERLCTERGITAKTADAIVADGAADKISSSAVRNALREGQPELAASLLGRPFAIEGEVFTGDQRGRLLGFPTANVELGDYLRPAFGVYATRSTLDDGRTIAGVANLGKRPTVDGVSERLEVHLFDFDGDLYGAALETQLISFIRGERKFDGLDALKAQIATDSETARKVLGL
ncbi:bifunctional riboflavin kinase/FAD synthetase [Maricaulaceae bacterium EIL42A08]|nr:bifunctional riboflavin kinase/FAD synthetase [Maricaulaceae bacterium EIL42A08]